MPFGEGALRFSISFIVFEFYDVIIAQFPVKPKLSDFDRVFDISIELDESCTTV